MGQGPRPNQVGTSDVAPLGEDVSLLKQPRRLSALVEDALSAAASGAGVLVTVVHSEGSSYLKAGAQLFLSAERGIYGVVSGGCLEQAIIDEALAVEAHGGGRLSIYDTSDPSDLDFGFGMGCGGKLWAFFEVLDDRAALQAALRSRDGAGGVEAIIVEAEQPALLGQRFQSAAEPQPGLESYLARLVEHLPPEQRSRLIEDQWQDQSCRIALVRRSPRPQLRIFGAGPGAWALADLAKTMAWKVQVYDHRDDLIADFPSQLAPVSLLRRGQSVPAWGELAEGVPRAAVIMSHHFSRDVEVLSDLLHQSYTYIGVLGSPKRCRALQAAVEERHPAFAHKTFAELHAPAGLDLGGDDVQAIALSILAEIQLRCQHRSALSLSRL